MTPARTSDSPPVVLELRAKTYPRKLTYRVTKPGYTAATYTQLVRAGSGGYRCATTAISIRAPDGSAAIWTVARAGYGSARWRA